MHELSIAHSILSIAAKAVPNNDSVVVTGVNLQIGELSGVEIESLQFAFSVIKDHTFLEKADLIIDVIQGEAACQECSTIFPLHSFGTCCPQCNSYSLKICKGREMRVLSIVVDE